jgi:SAM-dependent methyltransferase
MNAETPLNKLCQTADFDGLRPCLAELGIPHVPGREHRKQWEVAMAVRAFRAHVPQRPVRALGVGAGLEPTTFWLTNHCEQVHATDLYADPGAWQQSAPPRMLLDPASVEQAFPWNPRRLIVQHMDGRALRYEDATFDFVYSSSSIEHFGQFADVGRAMLEIARVVTPGGIVSLSTEFKLAGPGKGFHNVLTFTPVELCALIEAAGLRFLDAPDLTPDPGPVHSFAAVLEADRTRGIWTPHVKLEFEGYVWTSVHLALLRPDGERDPRGIRAGEWLRRRSEFGIRSGYRHRAAPEAFDDTPNRDQWQDDVYRLARDDAQRILDVGCGSAFKLLKYFGDRATTGLEVEPTLGWLREHHPERDWRLADFDATLAESFDLVLCVDVIEHVPDPDALLAFLARLNARRYVLSTPDRDACVRELGAPPDGPPLNPAHAREWNRAEFAAFVGRRLRVLEHLPADNCGQVVIATAPAGAGPRFTATSRAAACETARADRAPAATRSAPRSAAPPSARGGPRGR